MATTENNFTGNGNRVEHPFSFPYLKITDVKIGLTLGTGAEQVLATTKYSFPNATTLRLSPIDSATTWQEDSGAPKSAIKVRVFRETADIVTASTFYPGSAIRSSDLNDNFLQNLYVTREARNITGDSTTVANEAKTLAETADANATTALNNSRESDGSGGWTSAIAKATSASNTATSASNAVGDKIDKDGSVAMTAALTLSGAPTSDLHASTKKYVDDYLIDEDNMSTNSATRLPSQQSVKAYVDAHIIDEDNFSSDSATKPPSQQSVKAYIGTTNYTKTESDARYFTQDTETIDSTETWSAGNTAIATTQAIDNRIIALTTEVGGFVPLANETSFPATNPDINDGTGTLVSIKSLVSPLVANGSGHATITNGAGTGNNVTITGLTASTTYAAGYGMLVETTANSGNGSSTPPREYAFHRLLSKATEITSVNNNASNINTVATNIANVNTVGGISANVTTVAGISSNVTSVAGNATNINSAVSNATNINSAVSNATNINAAVANETNINSVAGNLSYVEDLGGVADALTTSTTSAISTVAANIDEIKSFDDTYKVASSTPSSGVTEGDLWYDSTNNVLKYYDGSSWNSISAGISSLLDDTTPELYAALDCNNKNLTEVATVSGDNLQIDFGAIA